MSERSTPAKWNGLPPEPSKSGLHYITDAVALWEAGKQRWSLLGKTRDVTPEWLAAQSWAEYRFPCPWPDQHADLTQRMNEMQLTVDAVFSGGIVIRHHSEASHA
jgi:hypothetical protein